MACIPGKAIFKKNSMINNGLVKSVAVIVAHPDDETLWTGGIYLNHPSFQWFTACLCRKNDTNRSPKYYKALKILNSEGIMGNLDDGPEQLPLDEKEVEKTILDLLPPKQYDVLISHNPLGEYTRHRRHEEIGRAVIKLWRAGKIATKELWIFAYEDGQKKYLPRPIDTASIYCRLSKEIWSKKYNIITKTYGFSKKSFEAKTTPLAESFWLFTKAVDAEKWLKKLDKKK